MVGPQDFGFKNEIIILIVVIYELIYEHSMEHRYTGTIQTYRHRKWRCGWTRSKNKSIQTYEFKYLCVKSIIFPNTTWNSDDYIRT